VAEFEPDQESVSRAEKVSSRLMQDLRIVSEEAPPFEVAREVFSERRYAELAGGVPINDVVWNVAQMAIEFGIARRLEGRIVCLRLDDGELAPISLTELLGEPFWLGIGPEVWVAFWEWYPRLPFPAELVRRWVLRRVELLEERVTVTEVREAEGAIQRNLLRFLSYRFAGMKALAKWIGEAGTQLFGGSKGPEPARSTPPPPPAVGAGGGFQVQVSCRTPGLRIHISPAYFINWVFFGSPTTPVAGYVLPGRYVFAGDGPMLPRRRRDPAVFCIPPTYYPALTSF